MADRPEDDSDSTPPEEEPDEEDDDVLNMFGEGGGDEDATEKTDGEEGGDLVAGSGETAPEAETAEDSDGDESAETVEEDGGDDESAVEDEETVEDVPAEADEDGKDTEDDEQDTDLEVDVDDGVFASVAESETEDEDDLDDEEFERALTQESRSAEEILATLEDSGALDPEQDADIDLQSEDLQTDDYTPEYLTSLFPLLNRSADWINSQYDAYRFFHPETAPVVKGLYSWEHFKIEYYYTDYDFDTFTGTQPRAGEGRFSSEDADESGIIEFDPSEYLGFDADRVEDHLAGASDHAEELYEQIDENTVNVAEELDEDEFFSTRNGHTTVVNRYDVEKAVPKSKKSHFEEINRYWVNKPFACVILFRSSKENEMKYYAIEPHLNPIEENVRDFLIQKLRNTIKYAGEDSVKAAEDNIGRAEVIEEETFRLLDRYNIYDKPDRHGGGGVGGGLLDSVREMLGKGNSDAGDAISDAGSAQSDGDGGLLNSIKTLISAGESEEALQAEVKRDHVYTPPQDLPALEGIKVRPEPLLIEEDSEIMNEYQVEKLLYYLKRDFVGYQKIDPVKRDINVEDISCDGYNMPVFCYHTDYENIISNIYHGEEDLDEFVVKLAQRSGKGISKRQPQVDATLPDGSRSQLTLGTEVSDHGTNYTIRQFKDVPFTPIDLINWRTFSLDEMAFLWLAIENNKSLIFAGGTASGKTTSLNAVSLFIPSSSKIVSIEDTREVELPQRNWIASVTRPSFSDDEKGDIDEFDLLEAALRQRPDYIVMGEVRGEEGRTLFQVMSTGHTTYTTFHADSVAEVLKRFTTDPINVSKTLFTALDLVSIQEATRVDGKKVRRNQVLTEVNGYDAETDEINVQDVYEWQAETDSFIKQTGSSTLEEIKFDRGWNEETLQNELFKRKTLLAYLIKKGLSKYVEVGATIQAFITDPETTLALIANEELENSISDLREMESVSIDVDPEKEALVPRPTPDDEMVTEVDEVLDEAEERLFSGEVTDVEDIDLADAFEESDAETGTEEPDTEAAMEMIEEENPEPEETDEEAISELPGDPDIEGAAEAITDSDDSTSGFEEVEQETTAEEESGGGMGGLFGEEVDDDDASQSETGGGGSIFEEDTDDPFSDTDDMDDLFDEDEDTDDDEELDVDFDDIEVESEENDSDIDELF